jgi:uncharacterized protein involved in response to NO
MMRVLPAFVLLSNLRGNWRNLLTGGVRLFFPAAAVHTIIGPLLLACLSGLQLPFAHSLPLEQWQLHEMIFGTFAAALGGAMMSAVAGWSGAPPKQSKALLALLALWLPGRLAGIAGAGFAVVFSTATDLAYLSLLGWFVFRPTMARRSGRNFIFLVWIILFGVTEAAVCGAWLAKDFELSARLLQTALTILVIMLASAHGRINVTVLNLALDPSGETAPYRPHPGRQSLAPVMTALYALAALVLPQSQAPAFLAIAAGCAFMDRLAEWFIGRIFFKSHVLALALANCLTGIGLIVVGWASLDTSFSAVAGVHILGLGGVGLAVIALFSIAGLRHTGRPLVLPWQARAAIALTIMACVVSVSPVQDIFTSLVGLHYELSAFCWAGACALWLSKYLPYFLEPPAPSGLLRGQEL